MLARYACLRVWLSPPVDTAQTLECGPIVVVCHQKSLHLSIILSTPVTTDSTCDRMHFSGSDQRHGFERRIIDDVHAKLEHIPLQVRDETAAGVKSGAVRTAYTRYNQKFTQACNQFRLEMARLPPDCPFLLTVGFVLSHCLFDCVEAIVRGVLRSD